MDLEDPAALGKASNPRFLAKVCTSAEIETVLNAPNPHTTLWTLWAIKEACYKVAQKAKITQVFNPKLFKCNFTANSWNCTYSETSFFVKVELSAQYVHAVALSTASWDCVSQRVAKNTSVNESEAVRELALLLLKEKGFKGCTITSLTPPQILQNGEILATCDVSLSHDGRFIAATINGNYSLL